MTTFTDTIDETFYAVDDIIRSIDVTASETINIIPSGDTSYYFRILRTVDEIIYPSDRATVQWHLATTARDKIGVSVSLLKLYEHAEVSETINIASTFGLYNYATREITEELELGDSWVVGFVRAWVLTDGFTITDPVVIAQNALVAETIAIGFSQAVSRHVAVIEALEIGETILAPWTFARTLEERFTVADNLSRFLGATVAEVIAIVSSISRKRRMQPTLTQNLSIADSASAGLLLQITAAEHIEITPDQALQMIFKPTISETIQITATHIDVSGAVTTWAVNLTNGAVTEYTNFDFNSFAPMGRKYLAASEDGLFELDGADDAGTDIIARMKSGIMQVGAGRLSSIKGIYLGLRGGGSWVLKVVADEDKTYIYSIAAKSMKTTKVEVGKGLRARYFAYELVSTGQEFDLDGIEFLPIVNKRRV